MRKNQTIAVILSAGLLFFAIAAMPTGDAAAENLTVDKSARSRGDSLAERVEAAENDFPAGQAYEQLIAIIEQARRKGDSRLLAAALINLGNIDAEREAFASAQGKYEESARIAEQRSDHALAAQAYANAARAALLWGDDRNIGVWLQAASEHVEALAETPEKIRLQLGLGRLILARKLEARDSERAYRLLNSAAESAEKRALPDLQSYAYGYLGTLYLNDGRLQEASALTNRAEFAAQAIDRPDILYRWQWQNGRILARLDEQKAALAAYRRAVATLKPLRAARRFQQGNFDVADNVDDLFIEWAELLLGQDRLAASALLEIRGIVEQGRAAELEEYYRDDCVAAWLDKTAGIDRLAEHTAALYPILLPGRLELLLSLPSGLQRYTVRHNRDEVRRLVEQFRLTLENRATPDYLPYAQALYRLLIEPVLSDLRKQRIDTLVFVPDAAFRTIPLAALHDGEDFLIKRFAVATSPGLTLTDPQPIQPENSRALLAGLSINNQGFQALPNVRDELRRIAGEFPATLLEDQAFRASHLRRQLTETPYRIVHIASHGQFGKQVANTFVLTADGKISLDDLGSMLGVNRFRSEPVELLTLSACQTAAGDERAALGLAGIAVKAGARSALASLWFINDPASADLVTEFYRQLKKTGTSKARALQRAQWLLLDDARYDHPGYWAPFLMIGNWL